MGERVLIPNFHSFLRIHFVLFSVITRIGIMSLWVFCCCCCCLLFVFWFWLLISRFIFFCYFFINLSLEIFNGTRDFRMALPASSIDVQVRGLDFGEMK